MRPEYIIVLSVYPHENETTLWQASLGMAVKYRYIENIDIYIYIGPKNIPLLLC